MTQPFIGMMIDVGFNFAPRNYALCNGQTLPINQNAALYSLLGTTYGGNGTTTFQLPNLQSRVAIHRGTGAGLSTYSQGQTGGAEGVSLSVAQMPQHTHVQTFSTGGTAPTVSASTSKSTTSTPTAGYQLGRGVDGDNAPNATPYIYAPTAGNQVALTSVNLAGTVATGMTGSGIPVSVIQPYNTLITVIALQGIFPSRN